MNRIDLERMRALIRSRHGLPEPPSAIGPEPVAAQALSDPSPTVELPAPASASPRPSAAVQTRRTFGRATSGGVRPTIELAGVAAFGPDAGASATVQPPPLWTPDASLLRLVELVMEMKALSGGVHPRSPLTARGAPTPAAARSA